MSIFERAIKAPRLVILAAMILSMAGLWSVMTFPKERSPRVNLPIIMVMVPNPGAPPEANESQIIRKIEDEAGILKGLKDSGGVYSQAVDGGAMVQFVFDWNISVDDAKRDVESLINRVKGEFPLQAQQNPGPIVNDIAFENFPIIQVFVSGGNDGQHRRRIAERLKTRIQKVAGVAGVDIFGGLEREVQIEVDPHRMTLYGFSYQEVELAIRQANLEVPSGAIEAAGGADQRVRTDSKLANLQALANVPLGAREGKPIVLGDIARISMGHKPLKSVARYGGEDSVVLLARQKTEVDVLAAADQIQSVVDRFVSEGGHEGAKVGTVRSQAREIHYMLNMLGSNAWQGTLLVVIMLLLVFGWRNAMIISLAFPICLLITFAFMWVGRKTFFPDLAINNMVLFALILVVGEVADGSIVIGENIYRHRELGRSPRDAAINGLEEVAKPVLFTYITTMVSFLPLFLVRGVMGDYLKMLPIVTMFALVAALLVDHFLLPVLSVYMMKSPAAVRAAPMQNGRILSQDEEEIANAEALVNRSAFRRYYGRMLRYALQHRLLVLSLSVLTMALPVVLFAAGAVGVELLPDTDLPTIEVNFEVPLGSSMERKTVEVGKRIEEAVMQAVRPQEWYRPSPQSDRAKPVTTVGEASALNTRLDSPYGVGPEFGMVYVELEMADQRQRHVDEIRKAIEEAIPPMPGVIVHVTTPQEGPPVGSPVVIRVLGQRETSLEALARRAGEIEELLRGIPGARDVTSDYRQVTQLQPQPDPIIASLFGLSIDQITTSVNYALAGKLVGTVDFGGDEDMDLRLRNLLQDRQSVSDLLNLPLRSPSGRVASLEQVATMQRVSSAHTIHHYQQRRVINLHCELEPGVLPDDIKSQLVEALRPELTLSQRRALVQDRHNKVLLADDTSLIEFGGETEIRDDAFADLYVAMAVALIGMLFVLVVFFNNFTQPLIALGSIPLSVIGMALGLLLWDLNFSVMAMIGLVALSGIVVDGALVLIELANKMRDTGMPLEKAIIYSGQLRIRPLLLTTLTNVVGLIPITLNFGGGGELWQPLSITIMFGLLFGTVVQLFLVPLAYYIFSHEPPLAVSDAPPSMVIPSAVPGK